MDALTPLAASAPAPSAPQAPHGPPDTPAVLTPVHTGPDAAHHPVDPLPALPAAVQRTQLEPAHPALMSREEMLNLLSLAV